MRIVPSVAAAIAWRYGLDGERRHRCRHARGGLRAPRVRSTTSKTRRSSSSPLSLRLGKLRALRWRDVDFARAVFACAPATPTASLLPRNRRVAAGAARARGGPRPSRLSARRPDGPPMRRAVCARGDEAVWLGRAGGPVGRVAGGVAGLDRRRLPARAVEHAEHRVVEVVQAPDQPERRARTPARAASCSPAPGSTAGRAGRRCRSTRRGSCAGATGC